MRLRLNDLSTSPNRDLYTDFAAAERPSRVLKRRAKNGWPTSHRPANLPSCASVEAREDGPDWDAVQEILLVSRPRLLGLAYAILRNKEDAEDAVQDALLSAYRHLRSFEGRSALTTWFTRIVLNAALIIRRKRRNSRIDSFPEASSTDHTHWIESVPASQPDPEVACALSETSHLINTLLEKMSPMNRQAFTMTYYDEMSNEEAGAVLGIPKGTFKSRLSRARQHLTNQVRRSCMTPIRQVAYVSFSPISNNFRVPAATYAEVSSPEIPLS